MSRNLLMSLERCFSPTTTRRSSPFPVRRFSPDLGRDVLEGRLPLSGAGGAIDMPGAPPALGGIEFSGVYLTVTNTQHDPLPPEGSLPELPTPIIWVGPDDPGPGLVA